MSVINDAVCGSDKEILSAKVSKKITEQIKLRAAQMRWSKSQYLTAILEDWVSRNCPAVHPADIGAEVQGGD